MILPRLKSDCVICIPVLVLKDPLIVLIYKINGQLWDLELHFGCRGFAFFFLQKYQVSGSVSFA